MMTHRVCTPPNQSSLRTDHTIHPVGQCGVVLHPILQFQPNLRAVVSTHYYNIVKVLSDAWPAGIVLVLQQAHVTVHLKWKQCKVVVVISAPRFAVKPLLNTCNDEQSLPMWANVRILSRLTVAMPSSADF